MNHAVAKKRRAGAPAFSSPFGSTSRLVTCPICLRSVHLLLATSHVESHFLEDGGAAGVDDDARGAQNDGAAVNSVGPASANAAPPHGSGDCERPGAGDSCGADAGGENEGNDDDVPFGGALCGGAAVVASGEVLGDATIRHVPGAESVWRPFKLQVMSGDCGCCGLCYERFEPGARDRFVFWPCQHARQCGPCALRIWQTPKAKRRCPWCASKLETRPRAVRPFM
jgi:hypothetical protein